MSPLIINYLLFILLPSSCHKFVEKYLKAASVFLFAGRYHSEQRSAEQAEVIPVPGAVQPGPSSS